MSRSSMRKMVRLSRKLWSLPVLEQALRSGALGTEAGHLLLRVVRPQTEAAWVQRAGRRTFKHLKEEVDAALMASAYDDAAPLPPNDDELAAVFAVERDVLEGSLIRRALRPEHCPIDDDDIEPPEVAAAPQPQGEMGEAYRRLLDDVAALDASMLDSVQMSWTPAADGERVERLLGDAGEQIREVMSRWVSEDVLFHYRTLEELFERSRLPGTFVEFLCLNFWQTWHHTLGKAGPWSHIHARDRFACVSPVCTMLTLTLHHLKFRGAGGGDEDENLMTGCPFCHLFGVHEGRIQVAPPASQMTWLLGRDPVLKIEGRNKTELDPLTDRRRRMWQHLGLST